MTPTQVTNITNAPSTPLTFVERALGRLAGVRNGILIFGQDHASRGDIDVSIRGLMLLRSDADANRQMELSRLAAECEDTLRSMIGSDQDVAAQLLGHVLDLVAQIDAELHSFPPVADEFPDDIAEFVERSFETLRTDVEVKETAETAEEFEIDEETLEIFRSEADELLNNIAVNVGLLSQSPENREALWEIRRNAHTFKGAAGIVGLKSASKLAHRIEDLLDKIVESGMSPSAEVVKLLDRSASHLNATIAGTDLSGSAALLETLYTDFDRVLELSTSRSSDDERPTENNVIGHAATQPAAADVIKPSAAPTVRVSLDRLDDLIELSRSLADNGSALTDKFTEIFRRSPTTPDGDQFQSLETLFETQRHLADDLHDRLFHIRLVRFGRLETRLNRTIQLTCHEEGKNACLLLENGDCEVDTQVIDALIEPLLHLLKNAVVHGIESEDERRRLGKPAIGLIRVRVETDDLGVSLRVEDDGRGISISTLQEKAVETGLISMAAATSMSQADALELIFERGLTTAKSLNLNAGRGIGMSIVKEAIESHGGRVSIASEPQVGTNFVLSLPATLPTGATPAEQANADESRPETEQKLVLIIDDSASVRHHNSKLVEAAGFRAVTAQHGVEAFDLLLAGETKPDLILCDVEMPEMDGWEFLEYAKSDDRFRRIPVVMVTSLYSVEHRDRAFELGATNFVVKPLKSSDLETAFAALN